MNWMDRGTSNEMNAKLLKYIIDNEGSCGFAQCVGCSFFTDTNNDGRKRCELSSVDGNDYTRKENAITALGKINK